RGKQPPYVVSYNVQRATGDQVTFDAVEGTEYLIAVDGKDGATGWIRLNVSLTPENDHFENGFKICGDFIGVTGRNVGASKEAGESDHAGEPGGHSIWWSWKAPLSGKVGLGTLGSSFDTVLAVYTGDSVSSLTVVATNDNTPDGNHGGLTSALTFDAVAGIVYH